LILAAEQKSGNLTLIMGCLVKPCSARLRDGKRGDLLSGELVNAAHYKFAIQAGERSNKQAQSRKAVRRLDYVSRGVTIYE